MVQRPRLRSKAWRFSLTARSHSSSPSFSEGGSIRGSVLWALRLGPPGLERFLGADEEGAEDSVSDSKEVDESSSSERLSFELSVPTALS